MTDWKVGDLAVCVRGGGWMSEEGPSDDGPQTGEIYRVEAVGVCPIGKRRGEQGLMFGAWEWFFGAHRFRKVQHDKPEACETAFTVLLNRSRRKVGA